MAETIHIKLPDGSSKEVPKGTTVFESISPRLADAAIGAKISSNVDQAGEGARPTQGSPTQEPIAPLVRWIKTPNCAFSRKETRRRWRCIGIRRRIPLKSGEVISIRKTGEAFISPVRLE